MPRARLPQLQSITDGSFEPNRRNPILLGEDSFLDDHQKPIRIGESASPLSLSKNQIRIDGDFHLEGKLANPLLTTDFEYLELRAEENIRFTSNNSTGSLDIFVSSGSPFYVASGSNMYFTTTNAGIIQFGSINNGISLFQFDTLNAKFQVLNPSDNSDIFTLDIDDNGETTISTIDNAGSAGHITLDADGDINIDSSTGLIYLKDDDTTFGLLTTAGGKSGLILYEAAGASTDDRFLISTSTNGATAIGTIDAAGTSANLTIDIDGDITLDAATGNITVQDDGGNYTPSSDYHVATKKYVDDNAGGGGSKTYLDWYYYQASLSNNIFYVSLHHDEFGVTSIANTNISDYNDTTAEDMWRIIRYAGKRVPYSGTVTKFMAHVESSGASADSDVEVGVWIASKPTLDTELASTTNMTIDNLGYMTFDFSSASRFLHKETTSFNATSVTQGDFMFITVRKTTGTDGTSFWIHSTVTMDIS